MARSSFISGICASWMIGALICPNPHHRRVFQTRLGVSCANPVAFLGGLSQFCSIWWFMCYVNRTELCYTQAVLQRHMRIMEDANKYKYENLTLIRESERKMFYLTTHSTHFIYGYMASDIWLRTILIVRKETRCRHIGYSYRLTARVLLCTLIRVRKNKASLRSLIE